MFLRRLVIRGFKSFADRTVFEFTPGIAVIVGPNGSGKSNLVDAIAWVLGEQGAKTLRGGKMEDVIFAGTPTRPALGRAEVELIIDNTSGTLPIDFTEVAISRTLFRTGESEYAINGVSCRLLDIQELLSDSGIGRELHTIIGQGQLDAILSGKPDERRAVIEEAAGLLKHRKRKDKALRKLERVDADVERLGDVIAELRRQIRPLERQAELAKQAAAIEEELRDLKLKLWLTDYRTVVDEEDAEAERRAILEVETLSKALADLTERGETLERDLAATSRMAEVSLSTEYRLSGLKDRFDALARLSRERARHLEDLASREPRGEMPTDDEIQEAAVALAEARDTRVAAEDEATRADTERAAVQSAREEAARAREEIVHLNGERAALRAAVESAEDERRRLSERRGTLEGASEAGRRDLDAARAELERLDAEETSLAERYEQVEGRRVELAAAVEDLLGRERVAERTVAGLRARKAMLEEEVGRVSDPAALLADVPGMAGRVIDQVRALDGNDRALRAALGPLAEAVLSSSRSEAMAALDRLKRTGGRASIAVPGFSIYDPVPVGVRALTQSVENVGPYADLVRTLLSGVALAGSLAEAAELAHQHPSLVIVTPDGDRLGPNVVTGGAPQDVRDPREALRLCDDELARAAEEASGLSGKTSHAAAQLEIVRSEIGELEERMNEVDAQVAGATERLGVAEREIHSSSREDDVLAGRLAEIEQRLSDDGERLRDVEARLTRAVSTEPPIDATTVVQIERMAAERSLKLGEAKERERAANAALAQLQQRASRLASDHEQWETGRGAWEAGARRASAVTDTATIVATRLELWVEQAREARTGTEAQRLTLEATLSDARTKRRETESALDDARNRAHEADLRRAERSHRIATLVQKLREEYEMSPDEAAEAVSPGDDVEELRRRANTLERKLGLLGKVNPIAMEQYQGMVDRHAFLTEQVNDLKRSRRDLTSVVTEVDAKIVEVFGEAFVDVAREFETVFGRLFPGGEGKLVLSEPDDLLDSGVDVEARPPGKRVKRVSLLSGGERSLTAIALLFAIFRARPSPFYLLDEVEAALDDVNLHRFLEISGEFRDRSQLLIVTHQKRTMEIGDALYGISMAGQGISKVICERLESPATEHSPA